MAANNGNNSTGKTNYYNVSYGMLCANAQKAPEGYEKISLSEIKSKREKNENVDLRNKYYDTENGKKYPLKVFYTQISGVIDSVEKDKYEKGTSLKVTLHDSEGDESVIQTDFYGKISADLLNRLCNTEPEQDLNFRPYSIPNTFETPEGKTISYYNAGVSVKRDGEKVQRVFNKDNGLPPTEQIENAQGEMQTSRVKQVNFLWEKIQSKYSSENSSNNAASQEQTTNTTESTTEKANTKPSADIPSDDLPF